MEKRISLSLTKDQATQALNQLGSAATALEDCQVWLSSDGVNTQLNITGKEIYSVQANLQQEHGERTNTFTPPKA